MDVRKGGESGGHLFLQGLSGHRGLHSGLVGVNIVLPHSKQTGNLEERYKEWREPPV